MRKVDATRGSLVKLIIVYTVPMILTGIIQNLFTLVDTAVLGNMADTTAVASIGATVSITSLILSAFIGLSAGTSIVLSRFVGQKDEEKIRATINTSLISAIGFGIFVAIIGVIFAPHMLRLIDCPEDCFDGAVLYIRIILASAPVSLLYNYSASAVRTLGDTQRPLTYIMIGGVINVVLNVILCLLLEEKVAAVGIATLVSNAISAFLMVLRLFRMNDYGKLSIKKMRFDKKSFSLIIRFGVAIAITNLILPIANLQITSEINSLGVDAVAGNSAASSITNIPFSFVSCFSSTATVFMGQNIGAKNDERVKKSFTYCLILNTLISGSLGLFVDLTAELWLSIILGQTATSAIGYGVIRCAYVTRFMFISAISNTLDGAIRAYGYSMLSSLSSIIFTLVFRFIWMQFIFPMNPTYTTIAQCFTVSWILNAVFYIVATAILSQRYKKGLYKKI